jgi:hypothetical protein
MAQGMHLIESPHWGRSEAVFCAEYGRFPAGHHNGKASKI